MSQRDERSRLARAVMDLIEQGHRGISRRVDLTRVRVLGLVAARGPVRPSAIAAELDMTASATSRHLTALERAGQVAVEPDPGDARTFLVRQTGRGRDEIAATLRAGTAAFTAVIADWSDEDVATARRLIERLTQDWASQHATDGVAGPGWQRARRERS